MTSKYDTAVCEGKAFVTKNKMKLSTDESGGHLRQQELIIQALLKIVDPTKIERRNFENNGVSTSSFEEMIETLQAVRGK